MSGNINEQTDQRVNRQVVRQQTMEEYAVQQFKMKVIRKLTDIKEGVIEVCPYPFHFEWHREPQH